MTDLHICPHCGMRCFDQTAGECAWCGTEDGPPVAGVIILLAALTVVVTVALIAL